MYRLTCALLFVASAVFLAGCDKQTKPTEVKGHGHDHSDHDRHDAMIEDITLPDDTTAHIGLQAHISAAEGSELDLFFEKTDKKEPLPIPMKWKITARVDQKGDDKPHELEFKPAKKEERKGDPDDKCSRFSADVPWIRPSEEATVVVTLEMDGKPKKATFLKFVPNKFIHKD
jgi:hypothetical protein